MDNETKIARARVLEFVAIFTGLMVTVTAMAYFDDQIEILEKGGEKQHD